MDRGTALEFVIEAVGGGLQPEAARQALDRADWDAGLAIDRLLQPAAATAAPTRRPPAPNKPKRRCRFVGSRRKNEPAPDPAGFPPLDRPAGSADHSAGLEVLGAAFEGRLELEVLRWLLAANHGSVGRAVGCGLALLGVTDEPEDAQALAGCFDSPELAADRLVAIAAQNSQLDYALAAGRAGRAPGPVERSAARRAPLREPSSGEKDDWQRQAEAHRRDAGAHAGRMCDCFEEAALRYRNSNRTERGVVGIGRVDAGRRWQAKMEQSNALAAEASIRAHNTAEVAAGLLGESCRWRGEPVIDLHGLRVAEALWATSQAIELGSSQRVRAMRIVTGVGVHSGRGGPMLQPRVQGLLRREGVRNVYHEGCFRCTLMQ